MPTSPFFLLFFFLLPLLLSSQSFPEEEDVIIINSSNIDQVLSIYDFVLLDFYNPNCGPCQKLAPEFARAAQKLKKLKKSIALGKIDGTVERGLMQRFSISDFPKLKFFAVGIEIPYKGGDTDDEIYKWVRFTAMTTTKTLENEEKLEEFISRNEFAVIYYGDKDDAHFGVYQKVTKIFEHISFGNVFDLSFGENYHKNEKNKIVIYKKGVQDIEFKNKAFLFEDVRKFIEENQNSVIMPLDKHYAYQIFEVNKPGLVLLADDSKQSEVAYEALKEAATDKTIASNFLIYKAEHKEEYAQTFMNYFQIQPSSLPQIRIVEPIPNRNVNKYQPKITTTITKEIIVDFGKAMLKKEIKIFRKSEPAPPDTNDYVKTVVGLNFDSIVKNPEKDVFLEIYAPWCGHCQKLEPIYNQLAVQLSTISPNIVLAKMDGTTNEVEGIQISGYPTLIFFPKNHKEGVPYSGNHDIQGMMKFLKMYTTFPFSGNIPISAVKDIDTNTFDKIVMDPTKHVLLDVYAPWCGHCQQLAPIIESLAERFRNNNDIVITKLDATTNRIPSLQISGYPTIFFYPKNNKKFPIEFNGDRTVEKFVEFINSNIASSSNANTNSNVDNDTEDALVLTDSNFESIVYNENLDVLVEFYAPWCGHCQQLAPAYKKLASDLKDYKNSVIIAKLDGTKNSIKGISVQGYPTIYLFKKNDKKNPIEYNGNRSVEDFKAFLKNNGAQFTQAPSPSPSATQENEDLTTVSGSNFKKIVYDDETDYMLLIYKNELKESIKSNFQKIAEHFTKLSKFIGFGFFNAGKDKLHPDIADEIIEDYPEVYIFRRQFKKSPLKAENIEDFEKLKEFILKETTIDFKNPNDAELISKVEKMKTEL